jgi:hypothetical protein
MLARLLALFLVSLAALAPPALAQTAGRRADVVVELYTSQGCSQCPRANRLLGAFARDDGVLALTFPVGIWDYLGWRDTFARPEFSERHRAYAARLRLRGRTTPQLVINGERPAGAADWAGAREMVATERDVGRQGQAPDVSITRLRNGRVRVTIGAGESGASADLWLVAYDPGPLAVTIRGGLNIDRTIAHYNLVRRIDRLAVWDGAAVWYERANCSPECAILVQTPQGGRILAAAYTSGRH